MDTRLREQLTAITDLPNVVEHPGLVDEIRSTFGHSIELRSELEAANPYTCAVFAFDLVDDRTYIEIASYGLGRTYAGAEFVEFVLGRGGLRERQSEAVLPDDLIVYFDDGQFRHIGKILAGNRVVSKWGIGHLWEHGIWEVPSSYGNDVKYFKALGYGTGLEMFIQFAESKGFSHSRGRRRRET